MSITFERQKSELILILTPERIYTREILDVLDQGRDWKIYRCFTVSKKHFRVENSERNEIQFCIGTVYDEYTHIDNKVLGTAFSFFFSNSIKLNKRHFVAYRNISILAKIDHIIKQDIYRWETF